MTSLGRANFSEGQKDFGRKFCDEVGWKLTDKYNIIQRPDKITQMNGYTFRTHTPTTHIWYQNKNNPRHHIWVEFKSSNYIIVKNGIQVTYKGSDCYGNRFLVPDASYYENMRVFYDNISARDYILNL